MVYLLKIMIFHGYVSSTNGKNRNHKGHFSGKTVAGEPEDLPAMFVDLPEGTRII